jgi:hypothetical protein
MSRVVDELRKMIHVPAALEAARLIELYEKYVIAAAAYNISGGEGREKVLAIVDEIEKIESDR